MRRSVTSRRQPSLRVSDVAAALEGLAPTSLAEAWDNVGLLAGDPAAPVRRALVTVDYTAEVAAEALRLGCELVVCYHPPIFEGLEQVTAPGLVYEAVRHGIALYAMHTALDVAAGGTNDVLARAVGMREPRPLAPRAGAADLGLGRVGDVTPTTRPRLLERIKTALGLRHLLVAGPGRGRVQRVAVCAGACGDALDAVLASGAQLYLTGELRHHDALRAAAAGVTVVCTLHSNSERPTLPVVADALRSLLPGLRVSLSRADRDPFAVVG
jgi:dinuclear metal center YbgI/SA1388 family protein